MSVTGIKYSVPAESPEDYESTDEKDIVEK